MNQIVNDCIFFVEKRESRNIVLVATITAQGFNDILNALFVCFFIASIRNKILKIHQICLLVFISGFIFLNHLYGSYRIRNHVVKNDLTPVIDERHDCIPVNSGLIRIVNKEIVFLVRHCLT